MQTQEENCGIHSFLSVFAFSFYVIILIKFICSSLKLEQSNEFTINYS